jgi:S1-C subfamily serine protease
VNPFDAIALVILVLAVLAGVRTGALPQIGGIGGAIIGLLVMLNLAPWLVSLTGDVEPLLRAIIVIGALLGAVLVGETIGSAIGRAVAVRLGTGVLSGMDRAAGALLGAAQALLIIWLAGGLLAVGPFPTFAKAASQSTAVRAVEAYLPPPTEVIEQVAVVLDDSGLPDVFVGLEPIPQPPVDTPTNPQAERIARAATASTFRVTTRACDAQVNGTAFLVAPGYLVTNAHVVAGASTIRVGGGTDTRDAEAVMFNPTEDLALLHVPSLQGPVLRFASSTPERGAVGAALGYTGGGPLQVLPAAVTGSYPATGRDIYGEDRITRDILELRAAVQPGDSGGPLILEDGTVGGLVFAESRTDTGVGYALTPGEVAERVAPAVGSQGSVDLGQCIR